MADDENAYEGYKSGPKPAKADKKPSSWNALIIVIIAVLGVMLPRSYRGFLPFLFLIPLVISLVNKFRNADEKIGSSSPNQTFPMPNQEHPGEPYLYTPKDPKDPRRYKPIG